MKFVLFCAVLASVVYFTVSINVSQCYNNPIDIPNLTERVKIGNCKKPPCRLRRNRQISVEIKLKPESDVDKLINTVNAFIVNVPFPFPGYDQTDACQFIYSADGKEKKGCPLKAGQEYLYKSKIDVLQIYPRLKTVVHWALTKPDRTDLFCFEVPARITD